jgi:RNA polymerase sigma-70 factor (ECF subfamily)
MDGLGESAAPEGAFEYGRSTKAFEALVEAYQDRLVGYAFRRLGDIHDAEDVVQGVFVRVFRDWAGGGRIRRTGPYLYRVAANACTDLLRKRRHTGAAANVIDAQEMPADRPDAAELAAAADELLRIDALLARLPERQAEVVRLRCLDGLCFAEIAEVVGCRLATAKSRFRYGLRKLRWFLTGQSEAQR